MGKFPAAPISLGRDPATGGCHAGAKTCRPKDGVFWLECPYRKPMSTVTHELDNAKVFYTVAEVASRFGISQKSVYRLLERGLLKSSTALRKKMIPQASVETFIAASLQGGAR